MLKKTIQLFPLNPKFAHQSNSCDKSFKTQRKKYFDLQQNRSNFCQSTNAHYHLSKEMWLLIQITERQAKRKRVRGF